MLSSCQIFDSFDVFSIVSSGISDYSGGGGSGGGVVGEEQEFDAFYTSIVHYGGNTHPKAFTKCLANCMKIVNKTQIRWSVQC